ncbi:TPA: hypothetical protein DDW35_02025 [Candidatus Sumerlaeota bacterium]|nr:hypothetical protein [Candidatus Sumerlaeota bacterium]
MSNRFTLTRFLLRSLAFHRHLNAATLCACAVAVAVLTGALLVGDSMHISLRDRALENLGKVDHAWVSDLYFRQELAQDLTASNCKTQPAILLNGAVRNASSDNRAPHAQIQGVGTDFFDPAIQAPDDKSCFINEALAKKLSAKEGDEVLLRIPKPSAIPRESLLGNKDDTAVTLRLRVAKILPGAAGRFSLFQSQLEPANIYVSITSLQKRLNKASKANTLLVSGKQAALEVLLKQKTRLEDAGLHLRESKSFIALESEHVFLNSMAQKLGNSLNTRPLGALTYLVNSATVNGRSLPYSMALGIDSTEVTSGVLLNQWAADDLQAKVGDSIALAYFASDVSGRLQEQATTLTVSGVLPMNHPLADSALAPEIEGVTDSDKISDWNPPFPLDLKKIRQKDEDYWHEYRAAPKIFLPLATAERLWANRFGNRTALLWPKATPGIREALQRSFSPEEQGIRFQPVKEIALKASAGSSDFGQLFLGFSFFLILSAALLIQALFRLGVEKRVREIGLLHALGFTPRRVRNLLLCEGAIIASGGAWIGVPLGMGWAKFLIYGFNNWWLTNLGEGFLHFAWTAQSLVIGFASGTFVALIAIFWACRGLRHLSLRTLLSGQFETDDVATKKSRTALGIATLTLIGGIAMGLAGVRASAQIQAGLFFGSGFFLLAGFLSLYRAWLGWPRESRTPFTLNALAVSSSRRNPGRAMLVASVLACAVFLLAAVGANRQTAPSTLDRVSGTGGFSLFAESSLPLFGDVQKQIQEKAGADTWFANAQIYPFRLRAGQEAGCGNLYQAAQPRMLGVTESFCQRGGFAKENVWAMLDKTFDDGAIPVIGDASTVQWLLHLGVGQDYVMDGVHYRFVALLDQSIFQNELLLSEKNFTHLYPQETGWQFFAIDAPADKMQVIRTALETAFENAGLEAQPAREKLQAFLAVENAYLGAFQSLGGFGLLLGTMGLGLAILRNALERRAEYALLRALGFRFSRILKLSVMENILPLTVGMVAGALSALAALAPALHNRTALEPLRAVAFTLLIVWALGIVATVIAATLSLRFNELSALKNE